MSTAVRSSGSFTVPCLIGLVGAAEGRRLTLAASRSVLGRDASRCQLVLEHALISREHAAFEIDGDGQVVVVDLGSKQGTFVNGALVTRQVLHDGDSVGFGRGGALAFRFQSANGAAPLAEPATPGTFSVHEIRARLQAAGETASVTQRSHRNIVRIGRAPDNDVVLDSPAVSRYHAAIRFEEAASPTIDDLKSTNGTFLNGEQVGTARPVSPGDLVFIGGFLLRLEGRTVTKHDLGSSRLIAAGITKTFGQKAALSDVSFAVFPREFVGLMGPSGSGKSTLMDALNGLRPATTGAVFVDELNLYENFDAVRRSIGYVPQRDVLHDALTVHRTLHYAARLRLPHGTAPAELERVVEATLRTVNLADHRSTEFHQLSGGQQKRLSLALELLTKPSFLFLDEPTSPLDPEASEQLMLLFRRLAEEGRIVVMVTHKFEQFEQMHQIALLTKGGQLAFFGPPAEALRYFGCTEPSQIYKRINQRTPDEVAQSFKASPQHGQFVAARLSESQKIIALTREPATAPERSSRTGREKGSRQFRILTERYLEIKLRDRRNTALLIAQAPVIALVLALIAGNTSNDAKTLFVAAIIAIWFGANNAVREVVAEMPIYRRERLLNLKIAPYLLSKVVVLSGVAVLQCTLLLVVLMLLERLGWIDFVPFLVTLSLTALSGIAMGLFFSALVNSTEKAMSVLPLILIPQLLLCGFMKPLDDVYYTAQGRPATIQDYERYQTSARQAPDGAEPIAKTEGLGAGAYVSALMGARWSLDALIHVVGRSAESSRAPLAAQLTVAAYTHVRDGAGEDAIRRAYTYRVLLCWMALIGSAAAFLGGAAVVLRSKDSL